MIIAIYSGNYPEVREGDVGAQDLRLERTLHSKFVMDEQGEFPSRSELNGIFDTS